MAAVESVETAGAGPLSRSIWQRRLEDAGAMVARPQPKDCVDCIDLRPRSSFKAKQKKCVETGAAAGPLGRPDEETLAAVAPVLAIPLPGVQVAIQTVTDSLRSSFDAVLQQTLKSSQKS